MANFTCKGCGNRYPGCHSHCEKYIAEKQAYEERMEVLRKEREIRNGLYNEMYNTMNKTRKRRGRQGASKYGGQ